MPHKDLAARAAYDKAYKERRKNDPAVKEQQRQRTLRYQARKKAARPVPFKEPVAPKLIEEKKIFSTATPKHERRRNLHTYKKKVKDDLIQMERLVRLLFKVAYPYVFDPDHYNYIVKRRTPHHDTR